MDRERLVTTAAAAVDLVLWMGPESYAPEILDDRTASHTVSPLAGREFRTELVDSMCVGPEFAPANMHVLLRLTTTLANLVEAHCQMTCHDNGPRRIEAAVYVDGEFVVRRIVTVQSDGSLRPEGMPDELRFYDPGFGPLVCGTCGLTVMQTVQNGRYYTCQIAPDVTNPISARRDYGKTPIPALLAGHLTDGRHTVCYS